MSSISTPTSTWKIPRMMRQTLRQWGYLISEAIPMTRQTLNLISLQGSTSSSPNTRQWQDDPTMFTAGGPTTATVKLDANTTRRLRAECETRGISLDSALLASLFLAAAEAVRIERQRKRQQQRQGGSLSARMTRFLVLAMVCVVMALLSGSVESKLLRYFCSFYAVIAGVWAVDSITDEIPGYTVVMVTRASIKAGEGAEGVTFTPVKMAVHCWRDLWDTADTHSRAAEGMALSMSEFARFKLRTWSVRGRRWRRKPAKAGAPAEARDYPPSFQLFGCIHLEGSSDGARPAVSPEVAFSSRYDSPMEGNNEPPPPTSSDGASDAAALLLIVLDARYTLVYRERRAVVPVTTSETRNSVPGGSDGVVRAGLGEPGAAGAAGRGGGGRPHGDLADGRSAEESPAASPAPESGNNNCDASGNVSGRIESETAVRSSSAAGGDRAANGGGLELTLVEGKRAVSGQGAKWLIERARAILVQSCKDGPPLNSGDYGDGAGGVDTAGEDALVSGGSAYSPAW